MSDEFPFEAEPELEAVPDADVGLSETLGVSPRRTGCVLAAATGAFGALVGALVAGLILVVVLSGDDSDSSGSVSVPAATTATSTAASAVDVADGLPPAGSTGDTDFWSQVFGNFDFLNTAGGAAGGGSSGTPGSAADGSVDIESVDFTEYWSRVLTGESIEPGSPLGSRIEGINVKAVLVAVQEAVVIVKTPTEENPDRGGSGFVVAADGHIVTNEHVVRDAETVQVRLFGGELVPAEVVASDPTRDLAVLKVDRDELPTARLGSTEGVEVGDDVIAIGNAFGIVGEPTVTAGIVSGLNRDIMLQNGTRLVRLIQTDAAINPGNSGGPLVNAAGEVIGVNTAIRSGFAEGIGYAISIDHARPIIDQLLDGVVQARAYLGVRIVSVEDVIDRNGSDEATPEPGGGIGDDGPETVEPGPDPDDELSDVEVPPQVISGALVVGIDPGEAADDAGIEAGDVIVTFEGADIFTSAELVVEILARVPGDRVQMGVIGLDGRLRTVELVLGSFEVEE